MGFIKKNLIMIVLGVVAVASIALAVLAIVSADGIRQAVGQVQQLSNSVRSVNASTAANPATIQKVKEISEQKNDAVKRTLDTALANQQLNPMTGEARSLLIEGILPKPTSDSALINLKDRYTEALNGLLAYMNGRGKPTPEEVLEARGLTTPTNEAQDPIPWRPVPVAKTGGPVASGKSERERIISQYPSAIAAERVARGIFMYVSDQTFGPHEITTQDGKPTIFQIWHVHMHYWIAQDFAAAFAQLNNKRAKELQAKGRGYDAWVANMPVKRWEALRIADVLGRGGGLNMPRQGGFGASHTKDINDAKHFVVPIRLDLIIEESALIDVMDAILSAGYYTPIQVEYKRVDQNPLQEEYIYGDDPIVEIHIDLEGYFFRTVYEQWIPEELKNALRTPNAEEDLTGRGRG